MPLLAGKENISHNISEMIKAGHPRAQSIAAAYRAAGEDEIAAEDAETKHDPANGQFTSGGSSGSNKNNHPHSHMHALQDRLFREQSRLKSAKTDKDREFREVQISQAKKEIAAEKTFLEKKGTPYKEDEDVPDLSDEELLKALSGKDQAQDEKFAFDKSVRTVDQNGYMHVAMTPISKATVNGYLGREINAVMEETSGWKMLAPDHMYQLLRDPEEIKKGAMTSNNIPLLKDHAPATADNFPEDAVIGSSGTDADFDGTYLKNSLVVWKSEDIDDIESKTKFQLSAAYKYRADMKPGIYLGVPYDGVMRDLKYNHIALCHEGRAGPDVFVYDSLPADHLWSVVEDALMGLLE